MKLRPATLDDAGLLFKWRNDPQTKQASVNQAPVEWDTHVDWLRNSLLSEHRQILIAEIEEPFGTVRLDIDEKTEISITLDPNYRGKGLAAKLLNEVTLTGGPYVARIRAENAASRRVFEKAGFTFTGLIDGYNWFEKH